MSKTVQSQLRKNSDLKTRMTSKPFQTNTVLISFMTVGAAVQGIGDCVDVFHNIGWIEV